MMMTDNPINLAVIFDEPSCSGGGFRQSLNAILLVKQLPLTLVRPYFFTTIKNNVSILKKYDIDAHLLNVSTNRYCQILPQLRQWIRGRKIWLWLEKIFPCRQFEKELLSRKIELVYFLSPSNLVLECEKLNYILTVWDLCHRDHPEFPEVRWHNIFEKREKYYQSVLAKAVAVLVDSEWGYQNIIHYYRLNPNRIHIVPFQPSLNTQIFDDIYNKNYIDVKKKYQWTLPYIFYPAQFWPHKNHIYLIYGLKALKENHNITCSAIFAGGDQGNQHYIKNKVFELGLSNQVLFLDFVPDKEIPYLYRQSIALVMPTYFGPTNLPPLEAFFLGVPVLYSDQPGLRDQVDTAALVMDLSDPNSLADHLHALMLNPELRERLIQSGKQQLKRYNDTFKIKTTLEKIIKDFQCKLICWKS
jgi:glycosyltransferase involved in cell wall biosynthesis